MFQSFRNLTLTCTRCFSCLVLTKVWHEKERMSKKFALDVREEENMSVNHTTSKPFPPTWTAALIIQSQISIDTIMHSPLMYDSWVLSHTCFCSERWISFIDKKVLLRDCSRGRRIRVGSVTDPPHLIPLIPRLGTLTFCLLVVVYVTLSHAWFCTYRGDSSVLPLQLSDSAALKTLPVEFDGRWSKTVVQRTCNLQPVRTLGSTVK